MLDGVIHGAGDGESPLILSAVAPSPDAALCPRMCGGPDLPPMMVVKHGLQFYIVPRTG